MFYSQCLLSRNGPLRAIWVAAYFHKKLKKEQIAQTDISSSVDEIVLNEYTVTYRVLGYLLLGVVRIYSKKVEYLFDDCQDCLVRINMYKKEKLPKESMCAPHSAITLPDTFALDAFDLEIVEDVTGRSDHVLEQDFSREKSKTNEQTLEEAWEIARNAYFLDKYQEEGTASFASSSHNAAIEDPPLSLAVDIGVRLSPSRSGSHASIEKLQNLQFLQEDYADLEMFSEADEPLTPSKQNMEMNNHEERIISMEMTPPGNENLLSVQLPQEEGCSDLEMSVEIDEPRTPSRQVDEMSSKKERQVKNLEIRLPGLGEPHDISKNHPVASPIDKCADKLSNILGYQGDATPEVVGVQTPARKDQGRRTRKRKVVWDDTAVLPNEVIKQSIYDSSSLVFKRRKAPVTALGTWRANTVPKLCQDFTKPLILGCSWLEDLFYKKKYKVQQVEADKASNNSTEKVHETQSKYSEQHVDMEESYVDPPPLASVGFVKCTTSRVSGENGAEFFSGSEAEEKAATEIPDLGLNLTDEEIGQHEDHQKSGELSVTTRKLAKYLSESFQSKKEQNEKEVLSLEPMLEGRTKRESAKLFYEILVLKTLDMINVKQEAPYDDIVLMPATLQTEKNL
ncbi:sister chromatid cohesion 1 protein 2-like [Papaver somniferum]|uniref:sister chromatid cohesion 1 protein 2-like n=1 Tax=Papaver somniferum TaxID=3469 RepID=UPI000E700051|nr:sister chromatid cohesion 1 protein 2-like [Papaver somniferum]